ncbi:MAG: LysO family transporter [Synergistales bacterium]|nr:LysO family transporter [Synergistales bacterium]
MDILVFALCLAIGIVAGYRNWLPPYLTSRSSWGLTAAVYLLLFLIGCELGSYRSVLEQMSGLGVQAAALCLGGLLGSALLCRIVGGRGGV